MGTKATPQTALDEGLVEDDKLEAALEDREKKRQVKSDATADFKDADDVVKGKLEDLDRQRGLTPPPAAAPATVRADQAIRIQRRRRAALRGGSRRSRAFAGFVRPAEYLRGTLTDRLLTSLR